MVAVVIFDCKFVIVHKTLRYRGFRVWYRIYVPRYSPLRLISTISNSSLLSAVSPDWSDRTGPKFDSPLNFDPVNRNLKFDHTRPMVNLRVFLLVKWTFVRITIIEQSHTHTCGKILATVGEPRFTTILDRKLAEGANVVGQDVHQPMRTFSSFRM